MSLTTKRKNFTVTEDLHHRTAVEARARKVTIEQLVTSAVESYLAGPATPAIAGVEVGKELSPSQRKLLATTGELLANGDPLFGRLLSALLDGFRP